MKITKKTSKEIKNRNFVRYTIYTSMGLLAIFGLFLIIHIIGSHDTGSAYDKGYAVGGFIREHLSIKQTAVKKGIGLGSVIAVIASWERNKSVLWSIIHAIFGWLYVIYFLITRKPQEKNMYSIN